MEMKFYRCRHCGNIVAIVHASGVPIMCCGEAMGELIPGESDGALEKHVPVFSKEGGKVIVKIGEVPHPMTEAHYIEWVSLKTKFGNQRKALKPGDAPEVSFLIDGDDEVEAVYAYCNLHSLWKA